MADEICDAITYADDINDDFGTDCTAPAVLEVRCSDTRWHPRCNRHVPVHFAPHIRPLTRQGSSDGV